MPEAAQAVDRSGMTRTETRYFECSVCRHQEWAAPGDYMHSFPNPYPLLGNSWRFKDRVPPRFCGCQRRDDPEHRDRKVHEYAVPTMKFYKATVWLKEGESLPNVGVKVTLMDSMQGKDPAEEKSLDAAPDKAQTVPQIVAPQGAAAKPEIEPGENVEVEDPDKLFGKG